MKSLLKDNVSVLAICRDEIHLPISRSNLFRQSLPMDAANNTYCGGYESTLVDNFGIS